MKINVLSSGSQGNCTILEAGNKCLMLDCGIPLSKIRQHGLKISALSAVLITHSHKDHSKAAAALLINGANVYAPDDVDVPKYDTIPYNTMTVLGADWIVYPFPVPHDVPNAAYYIKSLVTGETALYITDTAEIPMIPNRVDYLLAEVNFDDSTLVSAVTDRQTDIALATRVIGEHMRLSTFLKAISAFSRAPKEIHVMHISDRNADECKLVDEIRAATGTYVIAH